MKIFHNDWEQYLTEEMEKTYYQQLRQFLIQQYRSTQVYPDMYDIFNALKYTSFADTKVVIIGQDPYHEPGQAMGLSFSVPEGCKLPPSLRNIYKELVADFDCPMPASGDLSSWAEQGVLLLNTVLTVRAGAANSHKDFGWQAFTDAVVAAIRAALSNA